METNGKARNYYLALRAVKDGDAEGPRSYLQEIDHVIANLERAASYDTRAQVARDQARELYSTVNALRAEAWGEYDQSRKVATIHTSVPAQCQIIMRKEGRDVQCERQAVSVEDGRCKRHGGV